MKTVLITIFLVFFTYVENDPQNKIILDFSLMCKCKYFIVGSTSFHWWPAWLCNDENKIVVGVYDGTSEVQLKDLINDIKVLMAEYKRSVKEK